MPRWRHRSTSQHAELPGTHTTPHRRLCSGRAQGKAFQGPVSESHMLQTHGTRNGTSLLGIVLLCTVLWEYALKT